MQYTYMYVCTMVISQHTVRCLKSTKIMKKKFLNLRLQQRKLRYFLKSLTIQRANKYRLNAPSSHILTTTTHVLSYVYGRKKIRIRIFRKLLHAIEFLLVLDLLNPSMILTIFYCLFSRMVVLQSLKTRGTPHLVKWTFLDIFFLSQFFLYRYLSTFFKRKKEYFRLFVMSLILIRRKIV